MAVGDKELAITGTGGEYSGSITTSAAGKLVIGDGTNAASQTISAAQTGHSGATEIKAEALLTLGAGGAIANSKSVTVDGTFDITKAGGATIKNLSGSGEVQTAASNGLITEVAADNPIFSGTITGAGTFEKTGAGKLTLSGENGYTGKTKVTAGTLALADAGAIAESTEVELLGKLDISGVTYATPVVLQNLNGTGNIELGKSDLEVVLTTSQAYAGQITSDPEPGNGGNFTLSKAASGTAVTFTLSNAQTYYGVTEIENSTLILTSGASISNSSAVKLTGTEGANNKAGLNLSGLSTNVSINHLSGNEFSLVELGTGQILTLQNDKEDTVFEGKITAGNANSIIKQYGSYTLTFLNSIIGDSTNKIKLKVGGSPGHVVQDGGTWNGDVEVDGGSDGNKGDASFTLGSARAESTTVTGNVTVAEGSHNTLNVNGVSNISEKLTTKAGSNLVFNVNSAPGTNDAFLTVADSEIEDGTHVTAKIAANVNAADIQLVEEKKGNLIEFLQSTPITTELGDLIDATLGVNATGGTVVTSATAKPETKALAEGFLGGVAFLNQGADTAHGEGIARAVAATSASNATVGFGAIGGGSVKHKTGSHVDVDGYNVVVGLAKGFGLSGGKLTAGVFFEYGDGDYTSSNSLNTGKVKGKGDVDYAGGGFLARFDASNGAYVEGTARFGKASSDFKTAALNGKKYDVDSRYYGLSLGGGYIAKVGTGELDVYGRYAYSQQKGDKDTLGSGASVKFNDVDSQRLRIGARYTSAFSDTAKAYVGAAWEHEFDGKAKSSITASNVTTAIDAPKLKGSSGIAEIGLSITPSGNKAFTVDLGLQGYVGKRQGATGSVQAKYEF